MEKMYQQYKDHVEFRLVYIKEAHAADSDWSVKYAVEKGINQHKNYGERCQTAEMLMKDKSLTIPTLIDAMDDAVNQAYSAYPDRVFLVRKDGRLAVAADRGPWGFGPALEEVKTWLAEYAETGTEPEIPPQRLEEAKKRAAEKAADKKSSDSDG